VVTRPRGSLGRNWPVFSARYSRIAQRGAAIGRGVVDNRRHLVVRRDREEFRLELVARADVDRVDAVLQAGFFQQQGHFVAVRGGPVIQVDHGGGSGCGKEPEV